MILTLLLGLFAVVSGRSVHFCPPTTVDCLCGEEEEHGITIALNTTTVIDEETGMPHCAADGDPLEVCESRNCTIIPNDNFEVLFQKGRIVSPYNSVDYSDFELDVPHFNRSHEEIEKNSDPLEHLKYPIQFTYPRATLKTEGWRLRERRAGRTCRVPELKNSEVTCWKWPHWQSCKQNCIYGHGLRMGQKTRRSFKYTCRDTENKWRPKKFQECKPYLNCQVSLTGPGDLKCTEPGNRAAFCHIQCDEYDENPSERMTFHCDDRKKTARLPHCVALESNDQLILPP